MLCCAKIEVEGNVPSSAPSSNPQVIAPHGSCRFFRGLPPLQEKALSLSREESGGKSSTRIETMSVCPSPISCSHKLAGFCSRSRRKFSRLAEREQESQLFRASRPLPGKAFPAMDFALIFALLRVLLAELSDFPATFSQNGVSYFIKHLVCMLYLTYRNRKTALRFPEPELVPTAHSPESLGLLYPEREWMQERPKSAEHLKSKEDFHIFQGTHIGSGSTLIFRLSRLQEGLCQAFLVLRVKGGDTLSVQNKIKLDLSDSFGYYGCGLKLECLDPMRRWRINFNGLMKNQEGEDVHVKFGGIWVAGSHTFEYPQQISIKSMADALSHLHPFSMAAQVRSIYKDEFFYSQMGRFDLEVSVGRSEPEEIHLWGSRLHFAGTLEPRTEVHKFGYFRKGHRLHLIIRRVEDQVLSFGSAYDPRAKTLAITSANMFPGAFVATTDRGVFAMSVSDRTLEPQVLTTPHPKINDKFTVYQENATMDGEEGVILTLEVERYNRPVLPLPLEYKHHMLDRVKKVQALVLGTSEEDCKRTDLTGGKGSSLAVLTSISEQFHDFVVPRALVLTTLANDLFLSEPKVREAVDKLTELAGNSPKPDELEAACESCVSIVDRAPVPPAVTEALKGKLAVFGDPKALRFAVRSSAVGEDSEEKSAAGQMKTSLGVPATDLDQLLRRISECWASQFSFTAVSYKRQYGQAVAGRMAVVIQEMVSSQVSGIMFTCDPVTSDPQVITITANYGLGEPVVGARVDPDVFIVRRSSRAGMKLDNCKIGKKNILMQEDVNGGTVEIGVDEVDAQKACLTNSAAEKLALVGCHVESCYTTARDIEWALIDDRVYLLQNRHVTSITRETDFEVMNDMNGNMKSEGDIFSKANVAEIFPGALSPLGISILSTTFDILCREFQLQWRALDVVESSLYVAGSVNTLRKQVFLDASDTVLGDKSEKWKMFQTYGRDISREESLLKGVRRAPLPSGRLAKLRSALSILKMFFLNRDLEDIYEGSRAFRVPLNRYSSLEQLRAIVVAFFDVKPAALACCHAFLETSFFDDMVMSLLAKSTSGEVTAEVLGAAAELLRAGESIESVDVVLSLHELGTVLSKSDGRDEFSSMSPEEALEWLKASKSPVGTMFSSFLEKHGHRCVKEFDVHSQTWGMQPISVVKTLQVLSQNPQSQRAPSSTRTEIGNLVLPLSFVQRLLLNVFLPRARKAVSRREIAKSGIVRILHKFRLAFHNLADLMMAECRLPRKELVFYLSVDELYRLITTGDPKLIDRASRRERLHPKLDKEKYPILSCGFPKKSQPEVLGSPVMQVTGTPICLGVVEGRARVIKDFSKEAHLIRKDEILVTFATDTGWTPYFPLLAGIITEVGGLISHGAVVAREYRIPCVVGIENVTGMFVSGDLLRLDATKGVIQKIDAF